MMALTISISGAILIGSFVPALLIWIQIKLSHKNILKWEFMFMSIIIAIFVINYIFLTNAAPLSELKKLSLDLQNGHRAEMYVRENEEKEIIAYSSMKILNQDDVVVDEDGALSESRYETVLSQLTNHRSLTNSVWENEETLTNPQNMIFEYEEGLYTISLKLFLRHMTTVVLTLILIYGVGCFFSKRKI